MTLTGHTTLHPHSAGHVFEDADVTVFFGNRTSTRDGLALNFPDYQMMHLKQTHSDRVVQFPYQEMQPEADAHVTKKRRTALCIQTADCLPVMIYDVDARLIAGIHAGWRGVENEIIRKTAAQMRKLGATLHRARAWIGPHIGLNSFEVGLDIANQLEARFDAVRGYSHESHVRLPHEDPTKARIDLLEIACAQLRSCEIDSERIVELPIDTFTSQEHHSFRRDREKAERQISFIALK